MQYAYAKYEVAPPYSHGSWEPGYFGDDRLDYCTAIFNYPSLGLGGCGNSQMGPEKRWEFRDDLGWTMELGGSHQWKTGVDFSVISFRGDNLGSPLGTWTFPRDAEYDVNDRTTYPTQWVSTLPDLRRDPGQALRDLHAGRLADREQPDAQHGAALRRPVRLLQRGPRRSAGPHRRSAGPAVCDLPAADSVPSTASDARGDGNNFGPRIGAAWDATGDGRTNVHAGYGLFYENMRTLQNFGELTWPQSRQIIISNPSFPDALQGRSRDQFVSTAPPNITVMDNDNVSAYAHQFSARRVAHGRARHRAHRRIDLRRA